MRITRRLHARRSRREHLPVRPVEVPASAGASGDHARLRPHRRDPRPRPDRPGPVPRLVGLGAHEASSSPRSGRRRATCPAWSPGRGRSSSACTASRPAGVDVYVDVDDAEQPSPEPPAAAPAASTGTTAATPPPRRPRPRVAGLRLPQPHRPLRRLAGDRRAGHARRPPAASTCSPSPTTTRSATMPTSPPPATTPGSSWSPARRSPPTPVTPTASGRSAGSTSASRPTCGRPRPTAHGGVMSVNHPWAVGLRVADAADAARRPRRDVALDVGPPRLRARSPTGRRSGERAIGGSDFHRPEEGVIPGSPTTWLECADRSTEAVLDALRHGRIADQRVAGRTGP